MLHIPVASHAPAAAPNAPNARAALTPRALTKGTRTRAARALIEAGCAARGADGRCRKPATDKAAEATATTAVEVPSGEAPCFDEPIAHRGDRLRFALSVLGNTVGGAALLAGAFALPSVFATLASLLIA